MIINRILKICDLYGTRFHWYIGYKPKHYSNFGGIFSILSLIIWILLLSTLSLDDFKRTHPIISESSIPPRGYQNIKFGEKKLYIPWRIVDYDEKPLNPKGILYPKIYYFNYRYNNITGKMDANYTLLNYTLCSETSMRNLGKEFLLDIDLETLYCIDMEHLNMGGSFNAEFMNFIRLDIYLCENGVDYNEKNNKCTSYDEFEELHGKNNAWFFEVLYPKVQFQPTKPGIPVLILYQTYYYVFSKYSSKLDRLYLQEHVIEDEKGWIFNLVSNISYWGTYSIGGENYYRGETDILRYGSSSRLYSLKIYLNLGIIYYTRKYKKLWEIFSEIFLIVKGFIYIFTYLSEEMNDIYTSKKINEMILNAENKYNPIKLKFNFFNGGKTQTFINMKNNRTSLLISDIRKEKRIQKQSKKKLNGIDDSANIDLNNILNFSMDSNKLQYLKRKSMSSMKKHEKIKYPLKYYLMVNFLIKLKCKENLNKYLPTNFTKSFSLYRRLLDISSYITLYEEFEILKKVVMNLKSIPKRKSIERREEIILLNKNRDKKY